MPVKKFTRRLLLTLTFVWLAAASPRLQEPTPFLTGSQLTILQLNDVYELTPVDQLGGLARVATLKQKIAGAGATPYVLLAGDFLSSSVASSIFKGKQMIDGFNTMGLDLATLGNHEFDFGKELLLQRMAESRFQYIVANVFDETTGRPVGGAAPYLVRTFNGLKVGFFGLCLIDDEISSARRRGLRFVDPFEAAGGAVDALRRESVDAIVALTHLSYATDRELARRFPAISVIVGGHEHFPITTVVGSTLISKAGSDAKRVARIDLRRSPAGLERHFSLIPIDSTIPDDPATARIVARYESELSHEMDAPVGVVEAPLDARSQRLRTSETEIGNMVTDAMRSETGAEVALINGGSIRGDRIYPAGPITRRMVIAMQPFGNVVCKIEAPGRVLVEALNHGVSKLPAVAGQFPQISGMTATVDARAPAGSRVRDVRVGGKPLDADRMYSIAIPDYVLTGGDGYSMFAGQRVVVAPEAGTLVATVIEQYLATHKPLTPKIEGRITIVR